MSTEAQKTTLQTAAKELIVQLEETCGFINNTSSLDQLLVRDEIVFDWPIIVRMLSPYYRCPELDPDFKGKPPLHLEMQSCSPRKPKKLSRTKKDRLIAQIGLVASLLSLLYGLFTTLAPSLESKQLEEQAQTIEQLYNTIDSLNEEIQKLISVIQEE